MLTRGERRWGGRRRRRGARVAPAPRLRRAAPGPTEETTAPALEIRGLTKRFGHLHILRGVDLSVRHDEVVALIGENGTGKSTLVKCVARALEPDDGEILVGGAPLGVTAAEVHQQGVAVAWQDLSLCDNLDVTANLFLGQEPTLLLDEATRRQRAVAVLSQLGVSIDDFGRPVRALSGGQRQSVALARAMLGGRRVLILDEPTAALDRNSARAVQDLIRRHRASRIAILLVSHDLEAVCELADRVIVLRGGVVSADVATTEVRPDDLAALMSGIRADSTARRQLRRLHTLVDQLSEVEPSRTLPLIVSAMVAALEQERVAIHLIDDHVDGGVPVLRRSAAVGLPAAVLAGDEVVPVGAGGGIIGAAAELGEVVVTEDLRAADGHEAALAAGLRSAWAAPIVGSTGVLGTVSGFGTAPGQPAADQMELVSLYSSHAAAAIERERLLEQVTSRNRTLETLGGILEILAGPDASAGGLDLALDALRRGLGASSTVLFEEVEDGELVERGHRSDVAGPARREQEAAARWCLRTGIVVGSPVPSVAAVGIDLQDRRAALVARWPDGVSVGRGAVELLADASRSIRLAIERAALDAAREEATALRRANALQREFLSRLSHELRTPLTAIHGYADTLRQPDVQWDEASTRRFLDSIARESARLGRLVSHLLDASALETGLLRFDHAWCDVALVVEAAVACVPVAPPTVIDVHCDPGLPAVRADHDRLQQVLVNLIDNAVHHNPPGTKVRIEVSPLWAGDGDADDAADGDGRTGEDRVRIGVIDDGAGIPADLVERAFEPRVRGVDAAGDGVGLGLAIAKGIVEAHRGRLELRSGPGGTAAIMTLAVDPGVQSVTEE
ncbi:MAG: ATP-binding cassette domain-containing protein [Actinomycetota bacterium]|nr:ATP-binding cassette domain-containing protein [Actinomycetota bacterium]